MKKKIRAIQYGVGPIGTSIVRLMREKQAIEIIGAIDTDPAKIGRDLGEVAGAHRARFEHEDLKVIIRNPSAREQLEMGAVGRGCTLVALPTG